MLILTINSGSSSIKFSLYRIENSEKRLFSGQTGGIGLASGYFSLKNGQGRMILERKLELPDHASALKEIIGELQNARLNAKMDAVGHRLVHGGSLYTATHLVDAGMMEALRNLIPFAPDHLPHEIDAIRQFQEAYPGLRQVACFDTAFHRTMPDVARLYALPEEIRREGVQRYGFHGLSYEYIMSELGKEANPEAAEGRVVIAHLGNGASMTAVKKGKSMDTTMGFTPAGGLVMSTRSGDIDPGVIVYLLREKGIDAAGLNRMINKEAGLLGLSGLSGDMQELLEVENVNPRAAAAIDAFCFQARKFIGALAAVLGGLDILVFTGGIGENVVPVRERICAELAFLGIDLDQNRNRMNERVISRDQSRVTVRVIKTNEELMIARHTYRLMNSLQSNAVREKRKY